MTSARHGLSWWQPDVSYWVIRGLALLGLAWDVKLPCKAAKAAKRRRTGVSAVLAGSPIPPAFVSPQPAGQENSRR